MRRFLLAVWMLPLAMRAWGQGETATVTPTPTQTPTKSATPIPTPPPMCGSPVVTSIADSGPGTLRDAVYCCNGGTVTFEGNHTYALTSGEIPVTSTCTIAGNGEGNTIISGNHATRIFNISDGGNLTIRHLTIRDGVAQNDPTDGATYHRVGCYDFNCAGAIYSEGTLNVDHCSFLGNQAESFGGAILAGFHTTTTIGASTFSGNSTIYGDGGAVEVWGKSMIIADSTFANNESPYGGAIEQYLGSLLVIRSTFLGNTTGTHCCGGAIVLWGDPSGSRDTTASIVDSSFLNNTAGGCCGGAIHTQQDTAVVGSLFSGNSEGSYYSSGGGAIDSYASLPKSFVVNIANSTFVNNISFGGYGGAYLSRSASPEAVVTNLNSVTAVANAAMSGGAIHVDRDAAVVNVANSILGDALACSSTDGGVVKSRGHNLESGTSCGFTSTGDLQNTDPLLAPLGDNGGPTQTMALLPGSPAINAGDNATCEPTDQRGYVRPGTGFANCSIGAYEYNSPGPPCAGDCGGNREVTVDQILTMINIALGNAAALTCRQGDVNRDGQITVEEIVAAVDNALNGCADAAAVVAGV